MENFDKFLKLRDDLYVSMAEAATTRIASESLEDSHYIVAALLAAHIACCNTIINSTPEGFKERWAEEFISGVNQVIKNGKKATNTLH
jgi:hypothetical protein